MTTAQLEQLHELNRQQYKIYKSLKAKQPRKVRKLNYPMCLFWLNVLGLVAFVASNVAIKLSLM